MIIPWRPGCPHRSAALGHVTRWWAEHHPTWTLTIGTWPASHGPWRKGCAVRAAYAQADDEDVVVVTDADVIPTGAGAAVAAVGSHARWAVPCRNVYRLTAPASELVIAGKLSLAGGLPHLTAGLLEETYVCHPGGGAVVLTGGVFNTVPIDPRFAGYGQEDQSWSMALHLLAGAPMRGTSPLWHLWHPPQPRMRRGPTVSRGVGSVQGMRLWQRYRSATTPATMRSLVSEARDEFARLMGDAGAGPH